MLQPSGLRTEPVSGSPVYEHPTTHRNSGGNQPGARLRPERTCVAAGTDHGRIIERGEEAREPLLVGDRVVIDEGDVLTSTAGDGRVARRRKPARVAVGNDLHAPRVDAPGGPPPGRRCGRPRSPSAPEEDPGSGPTRHRLRSARAGPRRRRTPRPWPASRSLVRSRSCCECVYPIDRWLLTECARLTLRLPSPTSYSIRCNAARPRAHGVRPSRCDMDGHGGAG